MKSDSHGHAGSLMKWEMGKKEKTNLDQGRKLEKNSGNFLDNLGLQEVMSVVHNVNVILAT